MARRKKAEPEARKPIGERQPLPGDPFAAYIHAFNEEFKATGHCLSYGAWEVKNYGYK